MNSPLENREVRLRGLHAEPGRAASIGGGRSPRARLAGTREKYEAALAQVPDAEPDAYDRL
jgi:hypothetical protein